MIVAVPTFTPVTKPLAESTVALAGLLLIQVPPGVACPKVVVAPTHTLSVPVITAGAALMVICEMLEQPAPIA